MKNIGIFTSGGDSPGMNACIRAATRTALQNGLKATGILRGFQGMIEADFMPLESQSVSNILHLGGTILRSARSQDFRTEEGRKKAYHNLKDAGIDALVAIGGDGTFRGARIFHEEYPDIPVIGCPGTIDNDLNGTDYTIGFDTAINTAMDAIDKIKDTANAHDRLFFVEVMGRDAGFIALTSGIATGAEAVLIPENSTDLSDLISTLEKGYQQKKTSSIVVVAEGDDAGGAFKIAEKVKERSFDRYEIKVTVLGHIQRGGRPTCMERVRASQMGVEAVKSLMAGASNQMIGIVNKKIVKTSFENATKAHQPINPGLQEMAEVLSMLA